MFDDVTARPWHKQLWPWLLIAPPAASIVGGFALLWMAIASDDGLVTAQAPARPAAHRHALTPAEAARCAARDRACLDAPVEEVR